MKKTVVCMLAVLFFSCTAYAQIKKENVIGGFPFLYLGDLSNEDFFNQSDYIFEGKFVSRDDFPNADTSKIWASIILKVTHVLKGDIDTGRIELILNSGRLVQKKEDGYALIAEYNSDGALRIPSEGGIFFCKKTELSFRPVTGNPSVEPLRNERNAVLDYMPDRPYRNFELFGLNDLYFTDKEDFYQYACQFRGINIPKKKEKTINNLPDSLFSNPALEEFMALNLSL